MPIGCVLHMISTKGAGSGLVSVQSKKCKRPPIYHSVPIPMNVLRTHQPAIRYLSTTYNLQTDDDTYSTSRYTYICLSVCLSVQNRSNPPVLPPTYQPTLHAQHTSGARKVEYKMNGQLIYRYILRYDTRVLYTTR